METYDRISRIADVTLRIMALAALHGDCVGNWQLRLVDIDRHAVRRRVRSGFMRRVTENEFLVGPAAHRPLDDRTRRGIAIVHAGPGRAAVTRGSAAEANRLLQPADGTIHVAVDHHIRNLPEFQIVYHRSRQLSDAAITHVEGVPTLDITSTILELGHDHTRYQIARAMCAARDRDRFDAIAIASYLDAHRGAPGTAEVRAALGLVADGCNGTRGRAEDKLVAAVLGSKVLPVPDVCNRRKFGIGGIEPDLYWGDVGLVVFADGRPHMWQDVADKDRGEMAILEQHPLTVLRVPNWRIWNELSVVVAEIEDAYVQRTKCAWSRRIGWLPAPA